MVERGWCRYVTKLGDNDGMQRRPKDVNKCVFCGAPGPLTKEDVVSKWIAKLFRENFETKGVVFTKTTNIQGEPERSHSRKYGSASVIKLIAPCVRCNTTWMKDIEDGVIEVLSPMILGRPSVLNPDSLARVATWATLKALCFDLITETPRFTTEDDFFRLREEKSPAPGLLVWTAKFEGDPNAFGQFNLLPSIDYANGHERAHSFKLHMILGAFILDITFTPQSNLSRGPMHGRPEESFYYDTLWPMSTDLVWPPRLSLDKDSYVVFSRQDLYPPIRRIR